MEHKLDDNFDNIFTYKWGNCTSGLQSMVKGEEDYNENEYDNDCIWLLEKVELITYRLDTKEKKWNNLHGAITYFIKTK